MDCWPGFYLMAKAFLVLLMLAFLIPLNACAVTYAQDTISIDLGGPRKVKAVITERDNEYSVEVSLIPVRSFDAAMNRSLTREKARSYAVQALAQHLGGRKRQSATVKNAEVAEANMVDARFLLVMRIPRNGVQLTDVTEPKPATKSLEIAGRRSLLMAKDDYQQTLELIVLSLQNDLPKLESDRDAFYAQISEFEELGVTRLASLSKNIKSDRLLLSTERDQLQNSVVAEEKEFLIRLKKLVDEFESRPKGKE